MPPVEIEDDAKLTLESAKLVTTPIAYRVEPWSPGRVKIEMNETGRRPRIYWNINSPQLRLRYGPGLFLHFTPCILQM